MKKALLVSITTFLIFFWQFLLPNYYFWKSDVQQFYVPSRFYLYERVFENKSYPFWTERLYSGFPIYADFENAYLNPINVLSILIFGPMLSYKILHIASYLLGSICLYLWMKKKNLGLISFTVANLIYFFNSFSINHQIHFNIVAGIYLFPTIIYLIDEIIEKFQTKKIIYLSLVISYIALWGHAQTTFLVCFGGFIYFLFFAFKTISFKKQIFFGLVLSLLILIQILPQYIPSWNLYKESYRDNTIDYRQGSMIPRLAPIIFTPYLFGKISDYTGALKVQADYSYTEMYIYIGITSLILAILGIIFSTKNRFFFFLYTYLILFFVLSFNANNPLFSSETPILNFFRYWQRSMILFSFAIAIFSGIFLENIYEKKLKLNELVSSFIYISLPITYIYILSFFDTGFEKGFQINGLEYLKNLTTFSNYSRISSFQNLTIASSSVLILFFIIYFFRNKFKNYNLKSTILFSFIIITLIDLYYFNIDILNFRLNDIKTFEILSVNKQFDNSRAVIRKYNLYGNEYLYYKSWSPFGYSQFKEYEYYEKFYKSDLVSIRKSKKIIPKEKLQSLSDLGISDVIEDKDYLKTSNKKIDLILQNIDGEYSKKEEGSINLKLISDLDQKITLLLKYNENWNITNNNIPIKYGKEGLFINLQLKKGENNLSINYVPKEFYSGIYISLFLLIPTILLFKFKNKILHE